MALPSLFRAVNAVALVSALAACGGGGSSSTPPSSGPVGGGPERHHLRASQGRRFSGDVSHDPKTRVLKEVPAEPAALALIARASGGSVRDAQSIMGQLIAGAGPEGLSQAVVADQLGVTDDALLDAAVTAIAAVALHRCG